MWLKTQPFVVAHTPRQTPIPTSLHSSVTNTLSVKTLCPQTNCFSLYFRKNITCFSVGPLRICPVPSVCSHTVYRCVTTYCCFMRDISQCATCFGPMWAIIRKNHSYDIDVCPRMCPQTIASPCISVKPLRAGQVLLSAVELCIGGLRQSAVL